MFARVKAQPGIGILLAFVLVASILAGAPRPAQAVNDWPIDISNVGADGVIAQPDGSVIVGNCSYTANTSYDVRIFSSSGTSIKTIDTLPNQSETTCFSRGIVGKNNMFFTQRYVSNRYQYIVGYKNGVEVWQFSVATANCPDETVQALIVGSDGNLYFASSYYCNGYKQELVKIDASTGSQLFRRLIGTQYTLNSLQPYLGGVVLYEQYSNTFRYFNNAGLEDVSKKYLPNITTSENLSSWNVHPDGRLFLSVDYSVADPPVSGCDLTYFLKRIIRRNTDNTLVIYNVANYCLEVRGQIQITPSGGAAIMTGNHLTQPSAQGLLFSGNSATVKTLKINISDRIDANSSSDILRVDLRGNIVLSHTYTYNNDGDDDHHFDIVMFTPDGSQRSRFSSEVWKTENQDDFRVRSPMLDIAPGAVYAIVGDSAIGDMLHRFTFAGLDYEYQKAAMLAVVAKPILVEKNYVALGDSYSAGEGVPPFDPATDRSTNKCHRSNLAYARLLDQDPTLNISLQKFVACSGAVSQQVAGNGDYGQQPQVTAISASTNIITLTFGGNNVGFKDYLTACLTPFSGSCNSTSSIYATTKNKIQQTLPGQLDSAYGSIKTKIGQVAPTAKVYVVGYPYVIRPYPIGGSGYCPIQLSQDEGTATKELTDLLNTELQKAVTRQKDSRFIFVSATQATSPFGEHDMCGQEPYFNNWDEADIVYTAHPNAKGQQAYAQLIKSQLG